MAPVAVPPWGGREAVSARRPLGQVVPLRRQVEGVLRQKDPGQTVRAPLKRARDPPQAIVDPTLAEHGAVAQVRAGKGSEGAREVSRVTQAAAQDRSE